MIESTQSNTRAADIERIEKAGYKVTKDNNSGLLTQEDFFSLLTAELAHQDRQNRLIIMR